MAGKREKAARGTMPPLNAPCRKSFSDFSATIGSASGCLPGLCNCETPERSPPGARDCPALLEGLSRKEKHGRLPVLSRPAAWFSADRGAYKEAAFGGAYSRPASVRISSGSFLSGGKPLRRADRSDWPLKRFSALCKTESYPVFASPQHTHLRRFGLTLSPEYAITGSDSRIGERRQGARTTNPPQKSAERKLTK